MPVLNVLEGLDATGGMPALPFRPTETSEIFSKSFDWGILGRNPLQSSIAESRDRNERNDIISERFGAEYLDSVKRDAAESLLTRAPVPGVEAGGMQYGAQVAAEANAILNARIAEGRRTGDAAWQGLRTDAEIEEDQRNLARDAKTEFEAAAGRARTPTGRLAGSFGGGIAASLLDPVNVATIPFGVGAGASILRSIAVETLINAGVEAAQTPFVAAWQHEIGYKYGIGEAAADIALAGAGAGVLTGVTRGVGAGLRRLSGIDREGGARSMPILDDIANSPRVPSEARDAAKYMSRTAHIDENVPPTADIAEGRAAAQETQNAFREYRQPTLPQRSLTPEDVAAYRETADQLELDLLRGVEERTLTKETIDEDLLAALEQKAAFQAELNSIGKPQSVLAFLRGIGGIRESAGELKTIGIRAKEMPGLLNNKSGKTIDEAGEALQQAGYFTERPDTSQVLDAIADEWNGGRRTVKQSEINAELRRGELSGQLDEIEQKIFNAGIVADEAGALARLKESVGKNEAADEGIASYRRGLEDKIRLLREAADKADGKTVGKTPVAEAESADGPPQSATPLSASPEADLLVRPNDAYASMLADIEAGAHLEGDDAFDADFERLLRDNADETVLVDGENVRLGDLSEEIKADMNIVAAVKTCAIG